MSPRPVAYHPFLLCVPFIVFGCDGSRESQASLPDLKEGVYVLCEEVSGYSGETLEVRDGRFRYWFYSDVVTGDEPSYPLSGKYKVTGNTIVLDHKLIPSSIRTIATLNGVKVLWRADGLGVWEKDKRIHPYAVLVWTGDAVGDDGRHERPSIHSLYTEEMLKRESREYDNRFKEQPPEIRPILRAYTLKGEPDMASYTAEVLKAREELNSKLIGQLVALTGKEKPHNVEAGRILSRIFLGDFIFDEAPPFANNAAKRTNALRVLASALSQAGDRTALEHSGGVTVRHENWLATLDDDG